MAEMTNARVNQLLSQEASISIGNIVIRNWSFHSELSDQLTLLPYHSVLCKSGNFKTMSDLLSTLNKAITFYSTLYMRLDKDYFNKKQCQFVIEQMEKIQGFKLDLNKLQSTDYQIIGCSAYKLEKVMLQCALSMYEYLHIAASMHCMTINTICSTYVYFVDISGKKFVHQSIDQDKKYLHKLYDKDDQSKISALIILDSMINHYYSAKKKYDVLTSQYAVKSK